MHQTPFTSVSVFDWISRVTPYITSMLDMTHLTSTNPRSDSQNWALMGRFSIWKKISILFPFPPGWCRCHNKTARHLHMNLEFLTRYSLVKTCLPGDSKCPFHPLVGGHLTPWKGHLTIPKRSLWITRWCFLFPNATFKKQKSWHETWAMKKNECFRCPGSYRDPYFMGRVSFPQTAHNQGGGFSHSSNGSFCS